jgi:hypothetical protein
MIQQSEIKTNYSSSVNLSLIVGDRSWELASIGPDHITLRNGGIELDRCRAQVVMVVDGESRRWDVFLTNGVVPFDTRIAISNIDP